MLNLYQVTIQVAGSADMLTPQFVAADEAACRVLAESWLASIGIQHVGGMRFEVINQDRRDDPAPAPAEDETPKRRGR
jgi:hypothetical protein